MKIIPLPPIYADELKHGLFWCEFMSSNLKNLLKYREKISILDFGCGGGGLLAALTLNGFKCEGVEINTKAIERCQEWQTILPKVTLQVLHYDEFCQNNEKYNLVIFRDVVEHIEDDKILRLVLQRASAVFIATPNRLSIPLLFKDPHSGRPFISILNRKQVEFLNRLTDRERNWRNEEYAMRKNYINVQLYSLWRLRNILKTEGFSEIINLSMIYYKSRQERRFLQLLSWLLPNFFFNSVVSPEIVLYASKGYGVFESTF